MPTIRILYWRTTSSPIAEGEAAPSAEWVACPKLDVAAVAIPRLVNGKVECKYYHPTSTSTYLGVRVVTPKHGSPKACLRDNSEWKKNRKQFANRMYCSYTMNHADLVKSAYGWSTNFNATRIEFGYRSVANGANEALGICRAAYKGKKYVGRVWRTKCYFPYEKKEQSIGAGAEYLVLTKPYGVPTPYLFTDKALAGSVVTEPNAPPGLEHRVCKFLIKRGSKLSVALGLAKDVTLDLPGIVAPPNLCVSTAKGKMRVGPAMSQLVLH